MMVLNRRERTIHHDFFYNLPRYLSHHPLMVFNNTRVFPAKLRARMKNTGRTVELLLTREISPNLWEAMIKGLNRLKEGTEFNFAHSDVKGKFLERVGDRGRIAFEGADNVRTVLGTLAEMPLPPYIRREPDRDARLTQMDYHRYQTVYAEKEGAIAAPTAGLHFTPEVMAQIEKEGADLAFITLHVGPGTFQPIRVENPALHRMESEYFEISGKTWKQLVQAKKKGQSILAIGSTSTRTLESVDLNHPHPQGQSGWTGHYIYPGYTFKLVGQMLTNFHLPRSTLLLMVSAFAGTELIRKAYQEAIREQYRFFSYGDAMLIL